MSPPGYPAVQDLHGVRSIHTKTLEPLTKDHFEELYHPETPGGAFGVLRVDHPVTAVIGVKLTGEFPQKIGHVMGFSASGRLPKNVRVIQGIQK